MRFVRISQPEVDAVRKLYEGVMSYACHGLFFREGLVVADQIVAAMEKGADFMESAKKLLVARGWIMDATFAPDEVTVKGSVEVSPGADGETCHRLRGILSRLYEVNEKSKVRFAEVECESLGRPECLFKREGTQ